MYHYHNEYAAFGIGAIAYYGGLSPQRKRFIDEMTAAILKAGQCCGRPVRGSAAKASVLRYAALIVYFKNHSGIVGWGELPAEFSDLMPDAIMDGIIGVYAETETYMLEIP